MKKYLFLALLLCLSATTFLSANAVLDGTDPMIVRTEATNQSVQVLLANLEGVTTNVMIRSLDSGDVMFRDQVKNHNGFSFDFDLEELKQGRYILAVEKGETVKQQVILTNDNGIFLSQIKEV